MTTALYIKNFLDQSITKIRCFMRRRVRPKKNQPNHSELFWEFQGDNSLGLKTTSCDVFLFGHDGLITH